MGNFFILNKEGSCSLVFFELTFFFLVIFVVLIRKEHLGTEKTVILTFSTGIPTGVYIAVPLAKV